MRKNCEYCNKPFSPKTDRSRFCSDSCSVGFCRRKKRDALLQTLTCLGCQQNFLQSRPDQKYCSYECGKKHWDQKKAAEARANTHTILTCQHCHEEFTPERFYSCERQKFCSRACLTNFHKDQKLAKLKTIRDANPLLPRDCEYCKKNFTPTNYGNAGQKFCCNKCKVNHHKEAALKVLEQIRLSTKKSCPICEKEFVPQKRISQMYCSPYCRTVIGKRIYKMMQRCYENTNTSKADHSHDVLGYSPNDLLKHLQMFPTWDSLKQDSWHLDHIFPIIAFVRKGITDPKIICCLRNLQPLAGSDNCVKNDNYDQKEFDMWLETVQLEVAA